MSPWIPFLKSCQKFPIFSHISLVSLSTSTPKISLFDYLVNQHNFSPESASKVSSLSSTKFINKPQNADSVFDFLKETGFSKDHIEAVVQKAPRILFANLETTIKPKVKVFQDLGFHSADFADIISTSPRLLTSSADRLRLSILGLKNVLEANADICSFLKTSWFARVLMSDFEKTFVPNMEYLKSCGIPSSKLASSVPRNPWFFQIKLDRLKGLVQRVDEMGLDRKSKIFLEAVRVMCCLSKESWELKLKIFRDLGFSEQNILHAFAVAPQAFGVSERKIKEVTQLLLSIEGFGISDIVCNPKLFCHSVEKRFKPRLRVLKALENQSLLKKKPGLVSFFTMSDAAFRNKYVIPCIKDEL